MIAHDTVVGDCCAARFRPGNDRVGSLESNQRSQRISWMSALPPIAARQRNAAKCRLCCKSRKLQGDQFFRENTKQETIDDSYSLTLITEVACEFNVRR